MTKQGASQVNAAVEYFRTEVQPRLTSLAQSQEQTAIILERLQGRMNVQDNRLASLEGQPANQRASVGSLYQAVGTGVSVLTFFLGGLGCLLSPIVAGVIGLAGSLVFWLITSR